MKTQYGLRTAGFGTDHHTITLVPRRGTGLIVVVRAFAFLACLLFEVASPRILTVPRNNEGSYYLILPRICTTDQFYQLPPRLRRFAKALSGSYGIDTYQAIQFVRVNDGESKALL